MIVKSMSRSSNGGQLLEYVFCYLHKEEKVQELRKSSTRVPFTKEHKDLLLEEFKEGKLNVETAPERTVSKETAELELNDAIRINKATLFAKEFLQQEKDAGRDVKGKSLHLTSSFLIVQSKKDEQFYKLSHPTLFASLKQPTKSKAQPFVIRHNARARSIKGYIREFEKVEALRTHRRSDSPTIYHMVLSFGAKDKEHITDEMLRDLANKFIELRGPDNLFVGTKHVDKEHIHLHLVMSATDLAGRTVRISKSKFAEIKKELDQYQKERYPQLSHSLPEHGRKQKERNKEAIREQAKADRATDKSALLHVLDEVYGMATSKDHFLQQLKEHGYEPYYRSGTLTGVSADNRKFRFSRLGYDQTKLASLDLIKEADEKELASIRSLRENQSRQSSLDRLAALRDLEADLSIQSVELDDLQIQPNTRGDDRDLDTDARPDDGQSGNEEEQERSETQEDQREMDDHSADQSLDDPER